MTDGSLQPAKAAERFQSRGVIQGKQFDDLCRTVLDGLGFKVSPKPFTVSSLGCEFDAELTSSSGAKYWCEFKGSWHGPRPGLLRTDTVKKALCDVLLAHVDDEDHPPVLILTSHLPASGLSGEVMLDVAKKCGALLDVICVSDPSDMARLKKLA